MMLLNIREIIDIYFREVKFNGIVIQQLPNNKYKVIYESLDMPDVGRYIINEVEYTTNGWTVINPSAERAIREDYSVFIEELNASKKTK